MNVQNFNFIHFWADFESSRYVFSRPDTLIRRDQPLSPTTSNIQNLNHVFFDIKFRISHFVKIIRFWQKKISYFLWFPILPQFTYIVFCVQSGTDKSSSHDFGRHSPFFNFWLKIGEIWLKIGEIWLKIGEIWLKIGEIWQKIGEVCHVPHCSQFFGKSKIRPISVPSRWTQEVVQFRSFLGRKVVQFYSFRLAQISQLTRFKGTKEGYFRPLLIMTNLYWPRVTKLASSLFGDENGKIKNSNIYMHCAYNFIL